MAATGQLAIAGHMRYTLNHCQMTDVDSIICQNYMFNQLPYMSGMFRTCSLCGVASKDIAKLLRHQVTDNVRQFTIRK